MNKVEIIGRLTKDPETRYNGDMAVSRYTLAVDRRVKKDGERQTTDFIPCVAFSKNGEFAEKYFRKGMKVAIVGRIQTGSYTNKDNQRVYTTDVIVDESEFVESKGSDSKSSDGQRAAAPAPESVDSGFMHIPDGIDDDLPFN